MFCIVSWRVFWLTMLRRIAADAPAEVALTAREIQILDAITKPSPAATPGQKGLSHYPLMLAKLGGYLAHLTDILLGSKLVGN